LRKVLSKKEAHSIEYCVTYSQPKDSNQYAVTLDYFIDSFDTKKARVKHFVKIKENYENIFTLDDVGEEFLTVEMDSASAFVQILDIDGDGWLDVIFRSYVGPTALVFIHTFNSKSEKLRKLGMVERSFGEAEFFPYFVSKVDDVVKVKKRSITIGNKSQVSVEYVWDSGRFSLKE
jgi:hypothetical protein